MAILGRCPRCGYLLTDDKPVCPRCGISGVGRRPSSTGWPSSSGAASSVPDAADSKRYRSATALVATLVVVLLGVAIYGTARRGEQSSGGSDSGRISASNPSAQEPSNAGQQRSGYAPGGSQTAAAPASGPSAGMPTYPAPQRSSGSAQAPRGSVNVPVPASSGGAEIRIVTKPDPKKAGNLGIGLTLVVNGRPVSYTSRSPSIPKANIVIKNPDGQILHQDTAGMDKFTFG